MGERNVKEAILREAWGEEIEAIILGDTHHTEQRADGSRWRRWWEDQHHKVHKWAEVEQLLDFDRKVGEDPPTIMAWTKNRVIITVTYDSGYWYESLWRNPDRAWKAKSYGGGSGGDCDDD